MPELQPTVTTNAAMPAGLATPAFEDYDIALGCECADPALQIERWSQEALGGGAEAN